MRIILTYDVYYTLTEYMLQALNWISIENKKLPDYLRRVLVLSKALEILEQQVLFYDGFYSFPGD